jgi:phosphoserine phosphatase
MTTSEQTVPLCVDLDGTLVATDTLHESLRHLVLRRPWLAPLAAMALVQGRSAFKQRVSELVQIDASRLPYRLRVLDYIRAERASGRPIVLATAATMAIARRVADHTQLFHEVIASEAHVNRKGEGKLAAIVERFGGRPFDYMGDSDADIPLFKAARRAILVSPTPAVRAQAGSAFAVHAILD